MLIVRYLTEMPRWYYLFVNINKNVGLADSRCTHACNKATVYEQIGYYFADVPAGVLLGDLIWANFSGKTTLSIVVEKPAVLSWCTYITVESKKDDKGLTVVSWCTYPVVYIIKYVGLAGNKVTLYDQIGYPFADVLAKALFGVLIWAILCYLDLEHLLSCTSSRTRARRQQGHHALTLSCTSSRMRASLIKLGREEGWQVVLDRGVLVHLLLRVHLKNVRHAGNKATLYDQIGYSFADVLDTTRRGVSGVSLTART